MTHAEAMLKLLAIEPERLDRLRQITGWARGETESTLEELILDGAVAFHTSTNQCADYRMYFVKRQEAHGPGTRRRPGVVRKAGRNTRVEGPSLALGEHPGAGAPIGIWPAAGPAGRTNRATPAGSRGAEGGVIR